MRFALLTTSYVLLSFFVFFVLFVVKLTGIARANGLGITQGGTESRSH